MANSSTQSQRQSHDSWWHPTDYLRVVYKRRWVAIPAFLLVFVSGALDTIRAVPIYQARTQLLIERDARRPTSIDAALQDPSSGYYDDGFYMTQYKIIQSRSMALRTVEALDKQNKPEKIPATTGTSFSPLAFLSGLFGRVTSVFAPPAATEPAQTEAVTAEETTAQAAKVTRFLASLSVVPVRNSSLVDLSFRSPDPAYAARAVNELANQYRLRNLDSRTLASKEANDFLSQQLEEQRKKLEESEAALVQYRETHNAASVDDRQNIVVQKLTELNAQVTRAKIERLDKQALYNQIENVRNSGGSLETVPVVLANEVIQKLRVEIAGLEERRAQMAAQYGPNWPPMKELATSIESSRNRLRVEIDAVVGAVRNDYLAAQAKENSLIGALESQKGEAQGLDRKSVEYAALEREAAGNRQLYENLMQRAKETGVSGQFRSSNVEIVDAAEVPSYPVLPNVQRDLTVAGLMGLVLAFGLVFGFEYFDSRIKSPDEIKAHLGLPFLGLVPTIDSKDGESVLVSASDVPPHFSEAIKAIRTAVVFSSAEEGARSIVVTSTAPGEGKTLVSSNLAVALSQADQRTLIIDCDMRRPRIHDVFGAQQEPGISNVLVGTSELGDVIRKTATPNLSVVAAGHIPPNPAELLGSTRFRDLLRTLRMQYDWIIIDAPPVMAVTDAAVIGNHATGVVFVVGAEMTSRRHAAVAIEQLAAAKAHFIGGVLNRANVKRHGYYYSTYYRKDYVQAYTRAS
jgi:capsular exopolysaccharide synthesis family protein